MGRLEELALAEAGAGMAPPEPGCLFASPGMDFLPAESIPQGGGAGGLRVAAYIRVSTDLADQENSYETQERYFRRLLEQNAGWRSAGIYSDHGITGTCGEKRMGFRRLLRHCREGRIDRVICKSISRFARNTADFMMALATLRESRVTILFEKEGLDTANATSGFILTTLAAIAQEESRSISQNVCWSNEKRFPQGEVHNREIYGYRFTRQVITTQRGYCYRAVEVVPEEADVVRWVFGQVAAGAGYKALARELNRRQIPRRASAYTKKRMQHPASGQLKAEIDEGWTDSQIISMVKNERYTGDVLVQKTYTQDYLTHKKHPNKGEMAQYLVHNHHPAIISRALFAQVEQVRRARAGKTAGGAPRGFSGRLVCGCCGRFYHVRNTRNRPIWFCPSTTRNNGRALCGSKKVYEQQIVRMFRKAISQRFRLAVAPLPDDVAAADILSGRYQGCAGLLAPAASFVGQMLARLETLQRMDFMERDRAFLQRKVLAATLAAEQTGLAAAEAEAAAWRERLDYMEAYWMLLEKDHDCRARAIDWMRGLAAGKEGTVEFLNGMTEAYVKAFVLSITIRDPLHATFRWFDDTQTEVEMDSNVV